MAAVVRRPGAVDAVARPEAAVVLATTRSEPQLELVVSWSEVRAETAVSDGAVLMTAMLPRAAGGRAAALDTAVAVP
ncbi:hypothetical protein SCATT_05650 [Streptantibioticus cattleyicolor NRRL 8057 = DSM 46488]|uniref:Uncharacterized protein n=1 Tax=Streptantibioticus cattleyicolor (strain ATCC 35852 / DSM 46488 / JCM 4925 / NBRC 14057 / NRRL 8057) TaxID=1003195 RepID=G8WRC0_STREN|nr:hypothetical protein SCATT_05650 [Streptantibioticus cattleyicolor NRRL 8057 = DSM 46488]